MSKPFATLHLLCGKIASGKSTLAKELALAPNTMIISEDSWLANLYPGDIRTVPDYIRCAANLRNAVGPHVTELLRIGVSVVLDFPANTIANREWMRGLLDGIQSGHVLHFLDVPDDVCLVRLHVRNAASAHAFVVDDTEFHLITRYFEAPRQEEGFNVIRY